MSTQDNQHNRLLHTLGRFITEKISQRPITKWLTDDTDEPAPTPEVPPQVIQHPTPQTPEVTEPSPMIMTVVAENVDDYQWEYLGGSPTQWRELTNGSPFDGTTVVSGATTATLTLDPTDSDDLTTVDPATGKFKKLRCRLSNAAWATANPGDEYRYTWTVTPTINAYVHDNPVFTTQPSTTITVDAPTTTQISVVAQFADTYQWKKGGVDIVDDARITGATTATLSFATTEDADDGSFTCEISNTDVYGATHTATSNACTLTVNVPGVPDPTPALAYAPAYFELTEDYSSGNVRHAPHRYDFWKSGGTGAASIVSGALTLSADVGEDCYTRSIESYYFNFFMQPIVMRFDGPNFGGTAPTSNNCEISLADKDDFADEADAGFKMWIINSGVGIRIWMGFKYGGPADTINSGAEAGITKHVPVENYNLTTEHGITAIDTVEVMLDAKSYKITIVDGSNEYTISGEHTMTVDNWGSRGDSWLNIRNTHGGAANTATTTFDQVFFRQMRHVDFFTRTSGITDAGYLEGLYTEEKASSGAAVLSDPGITFTASGPGSNRYSSFRTHRNKYFNPWTSELTVKAQISQLSGAGSNVKYAYVGFCSTEDGVIDANDAIIVRIGSDKSVRILYKQNGGSSPASAWPSTLMANSNFTYSGATITGLTFRIENNKWYLTIHGSAGDESPSGDGNNPNLNPYQWGPNKANANDDITNSGNCCLTYGVHRPNDNSDVVTGTFYSVTVERTYKLHYRDSVYGPCADGINFDIPPIVHNGEQTRYEDPGLVHIDKWPFQVPCFDDTVTCDAAWEHVADFCKDHSFTAYVPAAANIRLSRQYQSVTYTRKRTNHQYDNNAAPADNNLDAHWDPVCWLGATTGARPRFTLVSGSTGYSNASSKWTLRDMISFWTCDATKGDIWGTAQNDAMTQEILNIDFYNEGSNPGAVLLNFKAAQACMLRNSYMDATGAYACERGGRGSGGVTADVHYYGGFHNIVMENYATYHNSANDAKDLTSTQPGPAFSGCTFENSTSHAITFDGQGSLNLPGCKFILKNGVSAAWSTTQSGGYTNERAMIVAVDTQVIYPSYNSANHAFQTRHDIYLENCFFQFAQNVVKYHSGAATNRASNTGGWRRVKYFAQGFTYTPSTGSPITGAVYVDHSRIGTTSDWTNPANFTDTSATPPSTLQDKWTPNHVHPDDVDIWIDGDYSGEAINSAGAKALFAANSGSIFGVKRGYFWTQERWDMLGDTALTGVGRGTSVVIPRSQVGDFINDETPIVRTAASVSASPIIQMISLHADQQADNKAVSAIIRSGNCHLHSVEIHTDNSYGYSNVLGGPIPDLTRKVLQFKSYAGGLVLGINNGKHSYMKAGYRHCYINNNLATTELLLVNFNTEHAQSDANIELDNAKNVRFLGSKTEGNFVVFYAHGCDNVRIYGVTGNATAFRWKYGPNDPQFNDPNPKYAFSDWGNYHETQFSGEDVMALVRIEDCTNTLVAMTKTVDRGGSGIEPEDGWSPSLDPDAVFGIGVNPLYWPLIHSQYSGVNRVTQFANHPSYSNTDRPVLWYVGNPPS